PGVADVAAIARDLQADLESLLAMRVGVHELAGTGDMETVATREEAAVVSGLDAWTDSDWGGLDRARSRLEPKAPGGPGLAKGAGGPGPGKGRGAAHGEGGAEPRELAVDGDVRARADRADHGGSRRAAAWSSRTLRVDRRAGHPARGDRRRAVARGRVPLMA